MGKVDLHVHSTASDGRLAPAEVVGKAGELGLEVIALTDHDTIDGIALALAAARDHDSLRLIPGVEVSTDVPHGEVHVLGYFVDWEDEEFQSILQRMRSSRRVRAERMIARLRGMGLPVAWERVKEIAGEASLGRPHIAQAMLEKGYVSSIRDAFNRYIGREGPAYVPRDKMTPAEAVALVLSARGLPVLAHPLTTPDWEAVAGELKEAGMVGIEAYCHGYGPSETASVVDLAGRLDLLVTGGSDFHGLDGAEEAMMGGVDVPMESAERLFELAARRPPALGRAG